MAQQLKVIIGPSSFAAEDRTPLLQLEATGVCVLPNPVGRRWTEAEAIRFLDGVDGLIAGLEPLNRNVLSSTRGRLKALARVGIGMNNVDRAAADELGIKVSNTPEGPTQAVAEMTATALLCAAREFDTMNRAMHDGKWPKLVARSVSELKILVVGFGRIGRASARLFKLLGADVRVCDPLIDEKSVSEYQAMTLAEGLGWADVLSLHASGDKVLLGAAEFAAAKRGMILLNPARGELVDENALIAALDNGTVSRAWFDTFWQEPYTGRLAGYPQVLLTPHASTYTRQCRLSMETQAVANLLRDLGLQPSTT